MDIVGPLRRTKRGNRYILTMMDFASRFPEAIPLRRIDAETVADALCTVFTKFGVPEEILSDQGSQFMSSLMKRTMALLGVDQIRTSPYHPQTDGMLERFHGTLKRMMQKRGNASKEWDMYLPYLCFAYRDSVHTATGFTPFQLLFGRDVRGPLSLLKAHLTDTTEETSSPRMFLEGLKERLHFAWEKVKENDTTAKKCAKRYYDKSAQMRSFQPGDQVLVFEPSTDKLEPRWCGPYAVTDKLNDVTYRVKTPERRKQVRQYHVNSLKAWNALPQVAMVTYCEEETEEEADGEPYLYLFERGDQVDPEINTDLTEAQRGQVQQLVAEYKDVFSGEPGSTHLASHRIATGEAKPVSHQPRRIPQVWQEKVREEVNDMIAAGVIEPSSSPWTSPVVPVRKKDGTLRLCIDYRQLNSVTQDDKYQMPRVEEMVERLGKAKYISKLDLAKGYYQVPVEPDDQSKTAFLTPMGKFQFKRMPFGLKGAPSTFQRMMDTLLAPCHQFAGAYIDDITVHSNSWMEHLDHLREVLQLLREANLTAKPKKCSLAMFECEYLGHRVGGGKIRLDKAKVSAITDFKHPRTKKDIRSFLGLAGYYRRFLPHFAQLTASLSDQTRKDKPDKVQWNDQLQKDFTQIKEMLTSRPILMCPDEDKQFIVQTDASERGIGAVLSQLDDESMERPVAFFSRKLLPQEERYSVIEKECLGIVAALRHFDVYLVGKPFKIVTDHRALRYLHTMRNANQRLTRWALAMQPFNFTIEHRPGVQNGNADGLSRQAWRDDNNAPHCCAAGEEGGSVGDSPLQQQGATPPSRSSCLPLNYDLTCGWKEDEITDAGICQPQADATRASQRTNERTVG